MIYNRFFQNFLWFETMCGGRRGEEKRGSETPLTPGMLTTCKNFLTLHKRLSNLIFRLKFYRKTKTKLDAFGFHKNILKINSQLLLI